MDNTHPGKTANSWAVKDIRDWVDIVFKSALAIVAAIVGYYFSFQKQQNEDIKLIVDMVTDSSEPKRDVGGWIAKAYYEQRRIPQEVFVVVYKYANGAKQDTDLRTTVNAGVGAASAADPSLQQAITRATADLPARVYFHIRQEADRPRAERITRDLSSARLPNGQALILPGIELVPGDQAETQLRCFKREECDGYGAQLIGLFKERGVTLKLTDLSRTYAGSTGIRPNHFEVWFAKNIP